jgi:hypothetical protein
MEPVFLEGFSLRPASHSERRFSCPMVIETRLCGFLRTFERTAGSPPEAANAPERLCWPSAGATPNGSWPAGHRIAHSAAVPWFPSVADTWRRKMKHLIGK